MKRVFLPFILLLSLPFFFSGCAKPLSIYTDADAHSVEQLVKPFTQKSGIEVNVVSFSDARLLADAIAVYSDGKYGPARPGMFINSADVVFSAEKDLGEVLLARNALHPYTPPEASSIPAGAKREGWWYGTGGRAWVLMWNTGLVKAPPVSLMDLAGDSFPSGSISMINPNYNLYYPCGAAAILGADKLNTFLQTLIDKQTQWQAKPEQTAADVASGHAWACITTLEEAKKQKQGGAPADWAVPDQGIGQMGAYLQYNVVCLPGTSTMPDQAKLLADYLLSGDAEKLSVALGLSDATMNSSGADAPVVKPLDTTLAAAQDAMQNRIGNLLTYFTKVNPKYKGK